MMGSRQLKIILEGIEGVLRIAFTIVLAPLLRRWYSRWGATELEVLRELPGDASVPHPRSELTCAITVHAPARHVWPWFMQLGCQRGGWYSYDLLDNGGSPSAERILPEYQHLEVGDVVKAVPNGSFGFPVAVIEPGRALSLAGVMNTRTGESADLNDPALDAYFAGDQTFVIQYLNDCNSRIIFRMRIDWNPTRLNTFIYGGIVEPVSFVMSRKMLLNIKRRAETLALEDAPEMPLALA
jgi:hypothetical protein